MIRRSSPPRRRSPLKRDAELARRSPVAKQNAKRKRKAFERAYGGTSRVEWTKLQSCIACGARQQIQVAHTVTGGMGRKADARTTVLPMSESPTHPDAPRAGGETPETRVDNLLRAFQNACERAHDEVNPYWRNAAEKERAILRNELRASLLARHRDGERESDKWFVPVVSSATPPAASPRCICDKVGGTRPPRCPVHSVPPAASEPPSAGPSPERASK